MTKRIMRYAGNKLYLVPIINKLIEKCNMTFETYIEPFLGSGAIFYNLEYDFSNNILNDLDSLITDTEYTLDQQDKYRELMKKHYQNLKYEIKEETINGDKATVTVEIEVVDYSKILSESPDESLYLDEEGNYSADLFYDYQLGRMEEAKETVKYTITFYLTKVDDEWALDNLSEDTKEKIHGIYVY